MKDDDFDPRISKLRTPEECAIFEENAKKRGELELAVEARKRGIMLKARQSGAGSDAERECLEAIYAYERVLSAKSGQNRRATRTWQMIKRHGILGAVERAVTRQKDTAGFSALSEMGLGDFAFESVVLRNPNLFSAEAVQCSRDRLSRP